jgi:TRAP-type C4-dicarboxylate transport system substrate-binding protein
MKKSCILLIFAVVLLVSISCITACGGGEPAAPATTAPAAKAVVLRAALPFAPQSMQTVQIQAMADKINERAGGAVIMEVHSGGSLCTVDEGLDAVRTGAVEMATLPVSAYTGTDERFACSGLPFQYDNVLANSAAQSLMLPVWNTIYESKFNQKALCSMNFQGLEVASKRPVKKLEDWKGLLVQSLSAWNSKMVEKFGASPVPVSTWDAYPALEKGVVDATIQASEFMVTQKIAEVCDYATIGFLIPVSVCITINLDAWNKLPKNVQDILIEEHATLAQLVNEYNEKMVLENPGILEGLGMEVYHLPKAERDRWKALMQPDIDAFLATLGDFGKDVKQVAEKVNRENP